MKIGIDARLYGLEHTGIGRYVMEFITEVLKMDKKNKYTIFTSSPRFQDIPDQKNVKVVSVDLKHYTFKEQLQLPRIIDSRNLDFIHVPHFNVPLLLKTPFIVTIHDLLWHEVMGYSVTTLNPLMYSLKYLAYRAVVRNAVKRSTKIITPSRWVKNQILKRFSIDAEKIVVTHEGVDHVFNRRSPQTKAQAKGSLSLTRSFSIRKPFIIYTGSLYPHKNVRTLVRALARINKRRSVKLSLIVVSARSIFTQKIQQLAYNLDQESYVKFVGFVPDDELARIYQEAVALVHPSTSEGFGLTGLEAMAAGLPVISSHAASLPEVYEEAALYFNPKSTTELADKISQVLSQNKLRTTLKKSGLEQVKKFSWKKMARETLNVYEDSFRLRQNK